MHHNHYNRRERRGSITPPQKVSRHWCLNDMAMVPPWLDNTFGQWVNSNGSIQRDHINGSNQRGSYQNNGSK